MLYTIGCIFIKEKLTKKKHKKRLNGLTGKRMETFALKICYTIFINLYFFSFAMSMHPTEQYYVHVIREKKSFCGKSRWEIWIETIRKTMVYAQNHVIIVVVVDVGTTATDFNYKCNGARTHVRTHSHVHTHTHTYIFIHADP